MSNKSALTSFFFVFTHAHTQFEVEMQDNWYETAISVVPPYGIISVIDWASDSPLPDPEPPVEEPATYNIFAWGVNDPSEASRSIAKENFDILASPVGWHSLPFANDPQSDFRRPLGEDFYRNTTTTWGNNVRSLFSLFQVGT
jgi:extracellular elastinolytic metalloproteinase